MSDNEAHIEMLRKHIKSPVYLSALQDRINSIPNMSAEDIINTEKALQHEIDNARPDTEEMWVAAATGVALRAHRSKMDAQVTLRATQAEAKKPPPPTPMDVLDKHYRVQQGLLSDLKKVQEPTPEQQADMEFFAKAIKNHEEGLSKEAAEAANLKDYAEHRQRLVDEKEKRDVKLYGTREKA